MEILILIKLIRSLLIISTWAIIWGLVIKGGINNNPTELVAAILYAGILCMWLSPSFPYIKKDISKNDQDKEKKKDKK